MDSIIASIPILLVVVLAIAFNWHAKRALPMGWLAAIPLQSGL